MIETLAQRLANFLPQYGVTLWGVLSAPIAWVVTHAPRQDAAWSAVVFWAASFVLYTLSRFLMFGQPANSFAYVAAVFLSNGLHLLLTALGFALVWRLFRAPVPVPTMIGATAYCWGAVIPVQTVVVILLFGLMRVLDEEVFHILGNVLNGCRDLAATSDLPDTLLAAIERAGTLGLWTIGLYAVLFLVLTAVFGVYLVAFLRALRRLGPVALAPFLVMSLIGVALWAVSGVMASGVYLMLLEDNTVCLPRPEV